MLLPRVLRPIVRLHGRARVEAQPHRPEGGGGVREGGARVGVAGDARGRAVFGEGGEGGGGVRQVAERGGEGGQARGGAQVFGERAEEEARGLRGVGCLRCVRLGGGLRVEG